MGIAYDVETEKLISGSITAAAQTIDLTGPNSGTDVVQITGTWVGTIVVEGSNDGTNFVTIPFIVQSTSLFGASITTNGAYVVASNGYNQTRIRSSAWTSGTATITDYGSNSPSIIYANATLTSNTNYGTVGANTIRTAAQIGNATGAANFNYGTAGAQTLRVAAQIGNATGAALFGAGTTTAQVLRVVLPTDQTSIPVTQSTSPWVVSGTTTSADDKNYGTVGANTIRTAAQIGNATGAADFDAGATGAQTLRTVANQGAPNTAANGWFEKITNGTNVADVTTLNDLQVADVPNQVGLSGIVALTTVAVEGKVGASTMTNRKYIEMQALDTNIKWGYDTTCPFDLFKNQFFSLPSGTNCKVYFKMSAGTGSVAISEK